ncbi:serine hydrolase [Streptomyces sioyaensis]|nr:serine hydrolase [Streptomyces sioyaensis]
MKTNVIRKRAPVRKAPAPTRHTRIPRPTAAWHHPAHFGVATTSPTTSPRWPSPPLSDFSGPDQPDAPMWPDTVFDAVSLTKILAARCAVGALREEGKLELDSPLGTLWPEVEDHPLGTVTAGRLLASTLAVIQLM